MVMRLLRKLDFPEMKVLALFLCTDPMPVIRRRTTASHRDAAVRAVHEKTLSRAELEAKRWEAPPPIPSRPVN